MTGKYPIPRVSLRLVVTIIIVGIPFCAPVHAKRKVFMPGQHAIVFDEGLSALRKQPDLKATLVQRLRRGRVVGILGDVRNKSGARFLKVAISRNTQGWILADAVVRPGRLADAERLMRFIGETRDDFTKVKLARLCADEFRATKFAPRALLILGETAERAAERLTRDARRRIVDDEQGGGLERRYYFLNYVGLDRYNRIGVTFDYDETEDRISYDGRAFRELVRRYPRSAEVKILKERSQR